MLSHLKRYKDIAGLLLRHGRGDLLKRCGLDDAGSESAPTCDAAEPKAEELAADLEKLGPTFIKLGQLLSTRGDLLPLPYVEALARLQDSVEPFPFDEVDRIVSSELGVRLSRGFSAFEREPVAGASLAQVHAARLRDGRLVAVKVQRPGIRERITEDLDALSEIAGFVQERTDVGRRWRPASMLEEFRRSIFRELDYLQEARNLETLAKNLKEFDRIVVPQPVPDYCSGRVLTMDYIEGTKITSLHPAVRLEIDGSALGDQLFRAYLKQIFVDGFLHADPHPGNVIYTSDGRLALLDLGMVVRIRPELRQKILRLLLAISEGRSEEASEAAIAMSETEDGFDRASFDRDVFEIVSRHQDAKVEDVELGRVVLGTLRTAAAAGVRFPAELGMVGQTLLKLENIGKVLAPDYRPNESIRRNALRAIRDNMSEGWSMSGLLASALDAKEFVTKLPGRVNRALDALSGPDLEIKVKAFDEVRLMEGLQKVANRITLGLILAGLIVGAALLVRVPTSFRILGYPGLAILFFLIAALGAFTLAAQIVFRDEHRKRRVR